MSLRSLSNNDSDVHENVNEKKKYLEFALLQTLSRLFQLVQFAKCWQIFLELSSKRLYQSSGKEKESGCLRRHFHVVVAQRGHKNLQKRLMHVLFCESKPTAFFAVLVAVVVVVA